MGGVDNLLKSFFTHGDFSYLYTFFNFFRKFLAIKINLMKTKEGGYYGGR